MWLECNLQLEPVGLVHQIFMLRKDYNKAAISTGLQVVIYKSTKQKIKTNSRKHVTNKIWTLKLPTYPRAWWIIKNNSLHNFNF